MPDETRTVAQEDMPAPTEAVADLKVLATAAGEPAKATLARANRPTVSGYELLEVVGKGGMGVVYRARQIALDRDIALKFLRDEYHPQSSTGLRFMEEARITAQLQHPGIPAVHEVGLLGDGRPYLAMKLIRGRTLDALLKEQGPGATQWLPAFEAICHAVGYAHAHSVIHRDLKPSNVMVGAFNEVQVMDWGLAKVLGRSIEPAALPDTLTREEKQEILSQRDTASIQTRAGSYLGTPAFMAPEQATGAVDQLSPQTDVFGLGGILCTLLTGLPPYLGSNSETTRLMAAESKLSDAISRLEKSGAEPELIELCKRCLAADPANRPADGAVVARQVAALRTDADNRAREAEIERARTEVHAAEQAQRRRIRLQWASGIAAALLLAFVGTGLGLIEARRATKEEAKQKGEALLAKEEETKAKLLAVKEKEVMESTAKFFLTDLLRQADATEQADARLRSGGGFEAIENPPIRELLDRAAAELTPEKINLKYPNQPEAQATVLRAVGRTYRGVGEYAKAIAFLTRAADLIESIAGADHADTLSTRTHVAYAYLNAGRAAEALDLFEKLRFAHLKKYGLTDERTHRSMNNLANAYLEAGKTVEAIKLFEEARDALVRTKGSDDPATLYAEHNLAAAHYRLAKSHQATTGKPDEAGVKKAIEMLARVREARARLLSPEHPDTLHTLDALALALIDDQQIDQAISHYERILAANRNAHGEFHPKTLVARNNLAIAVKAAGAKSPDKHKEAIERFEKLQADCLAKLDRNALLTLEVQHNLADAYIDNFLFKDDGSGLRLAEAIKLLSVVRDERVKKLGEAHPDAIRSTNTLAYAYFLDDQWEPATANFERVLKSAHLGAGPFTPDPVMAAHNVASMAKRLGNKKRAVELHLGIAKYLEQNEFQHIDALLLMIGLCNDFEDLNMYSEAEPWRRRVVWYLEQKEGTNTESKPYSRELSFLGRNLLMLKKYPDAVKVLARAYEIRKKHEGGQPGFFNTQSMYGAALLGEKNLKDAEPMLVEGYEGLKAKAETIPKDSQYIILDAGKRLLLFYVETKQDAKAEALRKELSKDNA